MTVFPGALDTLVVLGGPFANTAPITDPVTQIDADKRNVHNQATMAVEARIGINNSADTSSLSWATVSDVTANNLGLRFFEDRSVWPGAVGEDGIFLKDVTNEPVFHRAGEPVGTFYSLLTSVSSLQDAYDGGATIATVGGTPISISGAADFTFTAAANTRMFLDGLTTPSTQVNGVLELSHAAGIDDCAALSVNTSSVTDNRLFAGIRNTVNTTGALGVFNFYSAYEANVNYNGVGGGPAAAVAFYAKTASVAGGAVNVESAAMMVDATYDKWLMSFTGGGFIVYNVYDGSEHMQITMNNGDVTATDGLWKCDVSLGDSSAKAYYTNGTVGGSQLGGILHHYELTGGNLDAGAQYTSLLCTNDTKSSDDALAYHEALRINMTFEGSLPGVGGFTIK